MVEVSDELPELRTAIPSDADVAIAKYIADGLVRDGSVLQLGIGAIPDTVCRYLDGHTNLGVHSEMISDGVMHLVQSGAITGSTKPADRGRTTVGESSARRTLACPRPVVDAFVAVQGFAWALANCMTGWTVRSSA